ncbi:MAG: tyrosine recombinase [Bacteroidia bacterium]|nr:MAG: tyrosine recombinase [Bacteroidia bacterium]
MWDEHLADFRAHLALEKGLASNSLTAYIHDVELLRDFAIHTLAKRPEEINRNDIGTLLVHVGSIGQLGARSQSRLLSGLRAFFRYLTLEHRVPGDPTDAIPSPRMPKRLPEFLTLEEVNAMEACIDLSAPLGHRNLAIIETLYSCGLRVSELITLRLSHIYPDEEFIRVIGKGSKERLIPIGAKALRDIENYRAVRATGPIARGAEDYLFLNRRGKPMGRVMVFNIVKDLAERAGIPKTVSPHTLRHSFATALVLGGADLRLVQAMLGHESITTTEIYTHLSDADLHDSMMLHHPRSRGQ